MLVKKYMCTNVYIIRAIRQVNMHFLTRNYFKVPLLTLYAVLFIALGAKLIFQNFLHFSPGSFELLIREFLLENNI